MAGAFWSRKGIYAGADIGMISNIVNAAAARYARLRGGNQRGKLGTLFLRLLLVFSIVAVAMEVFNLHFLGRTRATLSRISISIVIAVSLTMVWLLSGNNNLFFFSDEEHGKEEDIDNGGI